MVFQFKSLQRISSSNIRFFDVLGSNKALISQRTNFFNIRFLYARLFQGFQCNISGRT